MGSETGIQLNAMPRRSVSSSTGARKQGDGTNLPTDFSSATTFQDEEKKGFFKHRGPGKRKDPKQAPPPRRGTDGEEISINSIGRFYNKIISFSIVTRYFVYVFPIGAALAVPIVIFGRDKDLRAKTLASTTVRVYLFFLWLEIVWCSVWVSKLMSKVVPGIFMALVGVVSSGTRKYALILKAVEIELSLVGWAVTSLVTFTALIENDTINRRTEPAARWIKVMKNLLLPAFFGTLILLFEKMVIQLISINYHRRSFDQRIKESKHSIHLLGLLYDASRALFPEYCPEFRAEDYVINDSLSEVVAKAGGHKRSGSATPLKVLGDIGRIGDKVTSVFGNIASEITGKQVFNPTAAHSIVVEALEKTRSSEALAKRLWMSFVVEGREALYAEDLEEVLGPSRGLEADDAFSSLDGDGNGDISLEEMILKVVEIGRDRKAIASSMHDVGQAIGVLDNILLWVLFVIVIFIFVAFQNTNFVTTLATAGTTLLSLSFVFAATTQEFLGSCIFLFVKHPFDVGDRVDIVGGGAEHLVVEQISLLYTLFKRIDTMKMVQVPNIVLNNLWVENVTRSKAMKEQLDMFIAFDTSLEDIELLRKEMEVFVQHPDNSRDFQPDFTLEAAGIGNMDKLQLRIEIRHKSNWHNETIRASRRSKFMCALVLALRKVPIYGPGGGGEALGGPTNPGYSVSVSDADAAAARDKAKKDKEGKRLVPPAPPADAAGNEKEAAEAMNSRDPVTDAAHLDGGWSSSRDDQTLGDRQSEDRRRSIEIGELREGLMKRRSTRGRRRAGDHVPEQAPQPHPNISVTGPETYQTYQTPGYGGQGILDEEAELGIHETHSTGPLGQHGQDHFGAPQPSHPSGPAYSIYPQQSQYQQSQPPLHPSTNAPMNTSQNAQAAGAPPASRSRKLSLSVRPGNSNTGAGSSSNQ
ncbi:hypothetical protein BJ875DRAFT_489781 [Amylocarpus encephaloides]|uniref:EF-hand domain-containing protein n=1 Tax=Amylocarpus encephaloides TaxID=45428 RepID=A0A9P7Y8D9_9HELO|nr:hypothetical protein BJ875DRAFT_489781 [Amylocarpus encephaloides]